MNHRIIALAFSVCAMVMVTVPKKIHGQSNSGMHHHYKLIDLSTLSYINGFDYYGPFQNLNGSGTLIGWADTNTPDPYSPNYCFGLDCLITYGFQWPDHLNGNLPVLTQGVSGAAHWISANGLIAGTSQNGETDPLDPGFPENQAVMWVNGKIINLGSLPEGGYESSAHSVNSRGQVVGWALNTIYDPNSLAVVSTFYDNYEPIYPYQMRAYLWENHAMKDLGTLGTGTDAFAMAINEAGQVIGISYTDSTPNQVLTRCTYTYPTLTPMPNQDPFLWENDKMIDLKSLGGTCGWPHAINNHGQVVGASDLEGDQVTHPFLWTNATTGMQDLTKGTPFFQGSWGMATKINESGDVVGWANLPGDTQTDAFLWDGTMHDLGNMNDCGHAWSINAQRQVIGHWGTYAGGSFPHLGDGDCTQGSFLWENGGPMVDLATLVSSDSGISIGSGALDINDRGEIAGQGVDSSGNTHAFLLIPCDANHPNIADCDYSLVDSTTADGVRPAAAAVNAKASLAEAVAQYRAKLANRHRGFGNLLKP